MVIRDGRLNSTASVLKTRIFMYRTTIRFTHQAIVLIEKIMTLVNIIRGNNSSRTALMRMLILTSMMKRWTKKMTSLNNIIMMIITMIMKKPFSIQQMNSYES